MKKTLAVLTVLVLAAALSTSAYAERFGRPVGTGRQWRHAHGLTVDITVIGRNSPHIYKIWLNSMGVEGKGKARQGLRS